MARKARERRKMIQVNEKYQIREEMIDLSIWEKNSKGKFICKGYYKSLSQAVRAIINREAHNSTINNLVSLETAITRLEGIENRYNELAEDLGAKYGLIQ